MNAAAAGFADHSRADVLIIGSGVIGLSIALELARAGVHCQIAAVGRPGAASGAAAGLLAPSVGTLGAQVRPFFEASLASYDDYIERLRRFDSGLTVLRGLIEVGDDRRLADLPDFLDSAKVAAIEPCIAAPHGARMHPRDGAIDNVRLVAALRHAVAESPFVIVLDGAVTHLELEGMRPAAIDASGYRCDAERIVLAAGAWSSAIEGLPRPLPISPLKGQMVALAGSPLRHPVMGGDVYVVPRESETVVGATAEHAGFDPSTDPATIERLRAAAVALCPVFASAPIVRAWAGIRPATPDMLPIIGPDSEAPRLLYACGHSKNGILLAPATAVAIAAFCQDQPSPFDLAPFSIDRFGAAELGG